jgi:hypothetical protein
MTKYKVIDDEGITHHVGSLSECDHYRRNAYTMFGITGFTLVMVKSTRKAKG